MQVLFFFKFIDQIVHISNLNFLNAYCTEECIVGERETGHQIAKFGVIQTPIINKTYSPKLKFIFLLQYFLFKIIVSEVLNEIQF